MSVYSWVAGDCGHQVLAAGAYRQPGRRIADTVLEELEVAVGMAGLALGGRAEQRGDVVLALDVGLVREVQITPIGLRFARERVAQALFGLRSFQAHVDLLSSRLVGAAGSDGQHADPSAFVRRQQYGRSIRWIAPDYAYASPRPSSGVC
jgi:hypothetical protein